ncbi:MAG: dephospho-CoA kinase [Treponema sp.]|jgi:dephospho-CoA kinase|nr:dephospho-CoA kinase [Treponema sp.]
MNSNALIGLTGIYCAGKNYVARLLEARGFPVLDVDKLGHEVLEAEKAAVMARFGPDILDAGGAVDRRLLGNRVFGKPEALNALEDIVHPAANRLTEAWIARQNGPCVINAALLHRSSVFKRLDFIILVRAPFLARLLRARRRDRLPLSQLIRRFKSQQEFISQYLIRKADIDTIDNPGYCGFCSSLYRRMLENRLDAILSRRGTR